MIGFAAGGGAYDVSCIEHRAWWGHIRHRSDAYEYGFSDGTSGVYRPLTVFRVARDWYERGILDGMTLRPLDTLPSVRVMSGPASRL